MKLSTKKLGTKLLFFSVLTVLIPMLILGVISTNTVKDSMEIQGQDAIEKDLGISEAMFEEHIEKLELFTAYNAKNSEIINDIEEHNSYELSRIANMVDESAGADFVGFTDLDGTIIGSNLNSDVSVSSLVKKISGSGNTHSIEKISSELTEKVSSGKISGVEGSLAVVVSSPVYDGNKVVGYIVSIDVLNKDYTLVDSIKKATGDVATISLGKYRISTNLENNGQRVVGTAISDEIYAKVVNQKQDYYARTDVLGTPYLCGYTPLYDCQGNAVGMVFTGTLQLLLMT